jgi:peptide/nickel transport system permease protein
MTMKTKPWTRPLPRPSWLWLLVALHGAALLAPVLAPYDPTAQVREFALAPPTLPRLVDSEGALHLPFVYPWVAQGDEFGVYRPNLGRIAPLGLFVRDASGRLRLFGVRTQPGDPPAYVFLLGTDRFGRDVFSRLLYGARLSLFTGLAAALAAVGLGLLLGGLAGYFGGIADTIVMRAVELGVSLPWFYLLLAVRAVLPLRIDPQQAFTLLLLLVGVLAWPRPARLVRGVVMAEREMPYVLASRGFGAGHWQILRRHLLPAAAGVARVQFLLLVPQCIIAEVTLSFFGLGVVEPAASLGNLLTPLIDLGTVTGRPWLLAPAALLVVVVLGYQGRLHRISGQPILAAGTRNRTRRGLSSPGV